MSELVPIHAREEITYLPLIYIVRVPWLILLVGGRHGRKESSERMYERQIMCVLECVSVWRCLGNNNNK